MSEFNYDITGLDAFKHGEEFLGLFSIAGKPTVWIVFRAEETAGFNFVTCHGSPHPHYVPDPIAWARLPRATKEKDTFGDRAMAARFAYGKCAGLRRRQNTMATWLVLRRDPAAPELHRIFLRMV